MKLLIIGAHPDDCEILCGGLTLKCVRRGHEVRFLSMTDGSAGHHVLGRAEIAARRWQETRRVARLAGIRYDVWNVPDGQLMPDLPTRERLIRHVREFAPDVIVCPRPNDYHPDHRNAGLLVQDAAYMLIVPNCVPDAPAMRRNPVILFMEDGFSNPPFRADGILAIDDVLEDKLRLMDQHVSQFYEWLPYTRGQLEEVPADPEARFAWLHLDPIAPDMTDEEVLRGHLRGYPYRFARTAARYRDALLRRYGDAGRTVRFAEAFQVSEYGSPLTEEIAGALFSD